MDSIEGAVAGIGVVIISGLVIACSVCAGYQSGYSAAKEHCMTKAQLKLEAIAGVLYQ